MCINLPGTNIFKPFLWIMMDLWGKTLGSFHSTNVLFRLKSTQLKISMCLKTAFDFMFQYMMLGVCTLRSSLLYL